VSLELRPMGKHEKRAPLWPLAVDGVIALAVIWLARR